MSSITTIWNEVVAEQSPARAAGQRFYHPELDILRFFAFFAVFAHHALPHEAEMYSGLHLPFWMAKVLAYGATTGALGVDVFFVLSSYLITELLLREKALRGAVDVQAFYTRRVLRIWPLYFSFLGLAAAMQFFVPGQHVGWRAATAFSCLAGNWWIVFQGFPSSVIFPLWSVSVEEQFYLFWPVAVRRAGRSMMVALAVCMIGVANLTRLYLGLHGATETRVWCNTLAHLDTIAAGVLIAVLLNGRAPTFGAKWRVAIAVAGMALLASAANIFGIKADPLALGDLLMGYPLVMLGAAALLIAVLSPRPVLGRSMLVYLGRISYGLYVFHVLGLMCSDYMVPGSFDSAPRFALRELVALALTIVFAAVSYRWIESPFLKLKQRFTYVLSRG